MTKLFSYSLFISLVLLTITSGQTKDWMARINNQQSLSRLNIPGTHDTCALHGILHWGQCQTLTLEEQLNLGVRFLDIRCKLIEGELKIYHGIVDQRTTFPKVVATCSKFLTENPTEVILMSIMDEGSPEIKPGEFGAAVKKQISFTPEIWYQNKAFPTLGQTRGKIVVISRNREVKGIGWRSLKIQDAFRLSGENALGEKKKKIEKHSKAAAASNKGWYINFTSGTSIQWPPKTAANEINPWLLKRFNKPETGYQGIQVIDFISAELAKAIVDSNF